MRFAIACVLAWILAKVVHTQEDCFFRRGDELNDEKNELRHIDCPNLPAVIYSVCNYLKVEVLKIQNCPTKLIESKFVGYQYVRTLDMSFSSYTTLGSLHLNFEHLKQLNVSYNSLTEVQEYLFNNTHQLAEVDFSHNKISELHKSTFSRVPKLSTINVSHNQIEEIDLELFIKLFDLEELNLSDNKFETILEDTFKENSKLKTLNLRNNPIHWLDCNIIQLLNGMTSINVSFENVTHFELSCANPMEWTMNEEEIIFKNANTKNELRYPKMNFKNLHILSIRGNRLEKALDIVNMLGESIRRLDLSGNMLGKINETTFHSLNNLKDLYLSETNLSFAVSNPFEHIDKLDELDISYNNLRTLNVSLISITLSHLLRFRAAGNHFDNVLKIVRSLASNLEELDLSQNSIETLDLNTFEHFEHLAVLNLSDTHLQHFDVNPLKVSTLDISRNNLRRLNVTLLSHTLNRLYCFYAADNDFENTTEIIQYLGKYLYRLDLSGSYVRKLNETLFKRNRLVNWLSLRRTNLSIFDFKPFENFQWLQFLDISDNNLTKLNFSASLKRDRKIVFENLNQINLSENYLTQLGGLTKHSYPQLTILDITKNKLNCIDLSIFRKEWKRLRILGDPCGDENPTHVSSSSSARFIAVLIGVSALIITIIAVVVFLRWKSSSQNREEMQVSYRRNGNGEEIQAAPQPQPQPESNPEDHIYEEIEERERPYDRLNHMPISAANPNYDKLINRDRGTQP